MFSKHRKSSTLIETTKQQQKTSHQSSLSSALSYDIHMGANSFQAIWSRLTSLDLTQIKVFNKFN